jgi:hypothetical protein
VRETRLDRFFDEHSRVLPAIRWTCTLGMTPFVGFTSVTLISGRPVPEWQFLTFYLSVISLVILPLILRWMKWSYRHTQRKMPESETPVNVRILRVDGSVIRCGTLRDPDADEGHIRAWLVIPLEGYRMRLDDQIEADAMPKNSHLYLPAVRRPPVYGHYN